jgi:hypothetical protein
MKKVWGFLKSDVFFVLSWLVVGLWMMTLNRMPEALGCLVLSHIWRLEIKIDRLQQFNDEMDAALLEELEAQDDENQTVQ